MLSVIPTGLLLGDDVDVMGKGYLFLVSMVEGGQLIKGSFNFVSSSSSGQRMYGLVSFV